MELKIITVRELRPQEGKWLTQKDPAGEVRFFSKKVFPSEDDPIDNYIEVDEAEYQAYLVELAAYEAEQEKKMQEEMNPPTAEE